MSKRQASKIYKGYKLTSDRSFLTRLGYTKSTLRCNKKGPICEETKKIQEKLLDLDEESESKKHDCIFESHFMYIPSGRKSLVKKQFDNVKINETWSTNIKSETEGGVSVVKWKEKVLECETGNITDLNVGKKPIPRKLSQKEKLDMVNYNILIEWAEGYNFNVKTRVWDKKGILTPTQIFEQTVVLFVKSLKKEKEQYEWITFFLLESLEYCKDHDAVHGTTYEREFSEQANTVLNVSNMGDFIKVVKTLKWMPNEIKQRGNEPEKQIIDRDKIEK